MVKMKIKSEIGMPFISLEIGEMFVYLNTLSIKVNSYPTCANSITLFSFDSATPLGMKRNIPNSTKVFITRTLNIKMEERKASTVYGLFKNRDERKFIKMPKENDLITSFSKLNYGDIFVDDSGFIKMKVEEVSTVNSITLGTMNLFADNDMDDEFTLLNAIDYDKPVKPLDVEITVDITI